MKELGVGMIGFGFIGKVHAHAHLSLPLLYSPLPTRTKLIGVATATPESGQKAREQAGFAFDTRRYQDLLEREDIQLIHICTPNDCHFAAVRDALLAGKHIYCDKPLALNSEEAAELVRLAKEHKTVQQMTFNYRFVPAIMRARELVESGFLGDLTTFRGAYLHAGYVDPGRPYSWRLNMARSGGGAIADLGAHIIDLVRYLTGPGSGTARGGDFTKVLACLQTLIPTRKDPHTGEAKKVDVDDIATAVCHLENGAVGTIEASRLATGVQDELRLELHGSQGALRFNLMDPNWLQVYDARLPESALGGDRGFRQVETVARYPKPYSLGATKNSVGWLNFHIQSVFDFVQNVAALEEGKTISKRSPSFEDGLAVQRIITACQSSSSLEGAAVAVER